MYFVTACTWQRNRILAERSVHESLLVFAENGPAHGAWLGAFVLMPDHLHAFVALDDMIISLSQWMKSLKNTVSKTLKVNGITPPHWQKGYFDHVLRTSESYSIKWDYVRENPVRAGLVGRREEWPYHGPPFDLEYRRDRI